jgi:hypothetical protein
MSSKAIHLFVYEGRYGIKEKLGLTTVKKVDSETIECLDNLLDDDGE